MRRPLAALFLLPALLAASPPGAARAQTLPIQDTVTLALSAERWVASATARVSVAIDAAVAGRDSGTLRPTLDKALRALAPDAEWRFVRFDRSTDEAGLERWRILAEARLAEGALAGFAEKLQAAGVPGRQFRLAGVDFAPTLAEREAARTTLRSDLYRQALAELERLNAAIPGRDFRIAAIRFREQPQPFPAMAAGRSEAMEADAGNAAGGDAAVDVATRLELTADVELNSLPAAEELGVEPLPQ
ncbi:MAG TPA: hypothetical protein VEH84_07315 [Alphaproteobacteria bacterium]|nr:hypothetical protein [Alphaproteobacteria bacterium]